MFFIQNPEFERDYKKGYIFFSYTTDSILSKGIALFTQNEMENKIPVSHCGIIINENECIESVFPDGVKKSNFIKDYVEPDNVVVFLCKPRDLDIISQNRIESEAEYHIGKPYAKYGAIGSAIWQILGFTWIPWLRKRRNIFNSKKKMFCSELCATALINAYEHRPGCLVWHPSNIYPSTLFNDGDIFYPWDRNRHVKRKSEGAEINPVLYKIFKW